MLIFAQCLAFRYEMGTLLYFFINNAKLKQLPQKLLNNVFGATSSSINEINTLKINNLLNNLTQVNND